MRARVNKANSARELTASVHALCSYFLRVSKQSDQQKHKQSARVSCVNEKNALRMKWKVYARRERNSLNVVS